MATELEKVLKIEDDSELCSRMFDLVLKHYGANLEVSACRENDQVVLLVIHAKGIIDNGGFQYLFEGNFPGDPGFARALSAFKTIKAAKCARALEEALRLFPDSNLPEDISTRLKVYQSRSAAKRHAIDKTFWDGGKEIYALLAKHIRENGDAFKHL